MRIKRVIENKKEDKNQRIKTKKNKKNRLKTK